MTTPGLTNNVALNRFELQSEGKVAFLDYVESPGRIRLVHTEVPSELGGRGLGSQLARAALQHAAERGLRVVPQCGFVRAYIDRHPEFAKLVDTEEP